MILYSIVCRERERLWPLSTLTPQLQCQNLKWESMWFAITNWTRQIPNSIQESKWMCEVAKARPWQYGLVMKYLLTLILDTALGHWQSRASSPRPQVLSPFCHRFGGFFILFYFIPLAGMYWPSCVMSCHVCHERTLYLLLSVEFFGVVVD